MTLSIGFLIGLFGFFPPQVSQNQDYFSQAVAIQDAAWTLKDPAVLRKYTVLLTEFYSQQFLFQAFALSDLRGGENLWLQRKQTDSIQMSATDGLVENNLEELLVRADREFGHDLNVRFAIAQYLYRGRCCIATSRLAMDPGTMIATFEEASSKNIQSGGSLYVLALQDLTRDESGEKVYEKLEQAYKLNPHDADIISALSSQALSTNRWNRGGQLARKLFEMAPSPDYKAESLVNIARVFYHRDNCQEALTAVNASLDIQPRLALAWNIGMDCLRSKGDAGSYHAFIQKFLDQDLNDPNLFRAYLDYLHLRGVTPMDESYFKAYACQEMPSDIARMTQKTNLGNLHLQRGEFGRALDAYQQARVLATKLTNAPPEVGSTIDRLIELAKKKASHQ